jgi:hypothetical protein
MGGVFNGWTGYSLSWAKLPRGAVNRIPQPFYSSLEEAPLARRWPTRSQHGRAGTGLGQKPHQRPPSGVLRPFWRLTCASGLVLVRRTARNPTPRPRRGR